MRLCLVIWMGQVQHFILTYVDQHLFVTLPTQATHFNFPFFFFFFVKQWFLDKNYKIKNVMKRSNPFFRLFSQKKRRSNLHWKTIKRVVEHLNTVKRELVVASFSRNLHINKHSFFFGMRLCLVIWMGRVQHFLLTYVGQHLFVTLPTQATHFNFLVFFFFFFFVWNNDS